MSSPGSQTLGSPTSPVCSLKVLELLGLHIHMSQLLTIHLSAYLCISISNCISTSSVFYWCYFSGEPRLIHLIYLFFLYQLLLCASHIIGLMGNSPPVFLELTPRAAQRTQTLSEGVSFLPLPLMILTPHESLLRYLWPPII